MSWRVELGDCVEVMAGMPADSVDAVVTDPPYGLEFMGKEWDRLGATAEVVLEGTDTSHPYRNGARRIRFGAPRSSMQAWHERWAEAALRVLKPGGHLLAFGGTRTFHRLTCALEDAGFEIRDCIMWVYGSGFPKSLDVSKAIDKAAGAERVVVGQRFVSRNIGEVRPCHEQEGHALAIAVTAPATAEARKWQGWGTALKPAWEPIIIARKPLIGAVAENVQRYGTGALNVDACRIALNGDYKCGANGRPSQTGLGDRYNSDSSNHHSEVGRWPANLVHDGSPEVVERFPASADGVAGMRSGVAHVTLHGLGPASEPWGGYGGGGSAARFFYCAKADRADREDGCSKLLRVRRAGQAGADQEGELDPLSERWRTEPAANHHPTVKPTDLMRWLCRLVTPYNGTVLDPFTGSGSTGRGALLEGFHFVGIERAPEYVEIAKARIAAAARIPYQEALAL